MGNVAGRVLWNGKGAAGLEVKMCEDIQLFGGCKGKEFRARTDVNGEYVIVDVAPGNYALAVHAIEKDSWLYITAGLGIGARKYTVAADKILSVGDQSIFKTDLRMKQPVDDSTTSDNKPMLGWDAYPEAKYYEIYLTPEHGKTVYIHKRVDTNQLTVENPLNTCKYTWDVAAFNDQGTKIAEKANYFHFQVTGQPVSCYVQISAPGDKATLPGTGIKLSWAAHPTAAYYKVHMWKDETGSPKILDFLQVRDTSYAIGDNLKAGKYVWSVYAYDQFGEEVAGSGISNIIVE